jgi:polysaccharide export outer membrane protein
MTKQFMIGIIVAFTLLTGCADKSDYLLLQTEQNLTNAQATLKQSYEYIIMPQDRLQVSLYKNPEITSETASSGNNQLGQEMQKNGVLVNSQGYIFLPLINKVKVAGLTQTEASKRITSKYKTYLKIPTVYLEVLNKRVYVIGEVNKPGPVAVDREKLTVLEAIAHAGDLTDSAVRDNIIVLSRNAQNKPYLRKIDLTHFDKLSFNSMMLRPNDVVYVQPDGWKEFKVTSDNFTAPFQTITQIAAPFVTLKYLSGN